MKDIKSYIIGFLTCACLVLIMGANKDEEHWRTASLIVQTEIMDSLQEISMVGRYQLESVLTDIAGIEIIWNTVIDTKTGEGYVANTSQNVLRESIKNPEQFTPTGWEKILNPIK